ncbi:MAG: helix-turn-helix domain-containing protein [Oscillospiraceae bacterium]|nr:helix-turn-helix domain-containing protein [Oscillospiraceae bacterium]
MKQESTDALDNVLKGLGPEDVDEYLNAYADSLEDAPRPFAHYLRGLLRQKRLTQREVFERAGLSDRYGYRLLTQEKNTRQRDYILRLCFGAELSLLEAQRALKLYGMSELYAKIPRDAVLIIAFNREIYQISQVNELLRAHGMEPLKGDNFS